jgi:hypothetical protein
MLDKDVPNDVTQLAMMVGEMRGQMREVVHTLNNVSSKIDGLSREVIAMGPLAKDVARLEGELKLALVEINLLKQTKSEQRGAANLVEWVFRNWPGIIGFFVLIALVLQWRGILK